MGGFTLMTVFDIILIVFGAYLLFSGQKMKNSGKISAFIVPESEIMKISRKKEFISEIYGKTMTFGAVVACYGAYGVLTDLVPGIPGANMGNIIGIIIFIVVMVWFFRGLSQAKKKYMY